MSELSEDYYLMNCGGCRRVHVTDGKMDEWPYDFKKAKLCDLDGGHPHLPDVIPGAKENKKWRIEKIKKEKKKEVKR